MTFSTFASPGVGLQGGGGSGGGGTASLPISGNGATITTSTPLINGTQTWNSGATTFTSLLLNVTDTASAAGSLLMDLQVGGVSLFRVAKNGDMNARKLISSFWVEVGSSVLLRTEGLQVGSATEISFSSLSNPQSGSPDVRLFRDAANTLAQRNGPGQAQAFNLYNTYDNSLNYERGFMRWSAGELIIGAEAAGTGSARNIKLQSAGSILYFGSGGNVQWTVDSGRNLAPASAGATLTVGTNSAALAGTYFKEVTAPSAPSANNVVVYAEDNGSGKTRLMARFATGAAVQIAIEP